MKMMQDTFAGVEAGYISAPRREKSFIDEIAPEDLEEFGHHADDGTSAVAVRWCAGTHPEITP